MFRKYQQPITAEDRVIIGIGDSYTQGVGAYTKETWDRHNGKIDVFDYRDELLVEQYQNSWVNQLAIKLGYKSINLGHAGTGNRAAVKELYFYPDVLDNVKDAVVIYFLSGLERFDFINKDQAQEHHHFFAMWPNPWDKNASNKKLWEAYAESIHSEKFVALELMINLLDAQTYCRARGFRLIVAPAFDVRINRKWITDQILNNPMQSDLKEEIVDQFDWSQFYVPEGYTTFMEMLCDLEGRRDLAPGGFYSHFCSKPYPSRYITNCAHPALEGHTYIANEFYKVITKNK